MLAVAVPAEAFSTKPAKQPDCHERTGDVIPHILARRPCCPQDAPPQVVDILVSRSSPYNPRMPPGEAEEVRVRVACIADTCHEHSRMLVTKAPLKPQNTQPYQVLTSC